LLHKSRFSYSSFTVAAAGSRVEFQENSKNILASNNKAEVVDEAKMENDI
jgi:hypothetical protein